MNDNLFFMRSLGYFRLEQCKNRQFDAKFDMCRDIRTRFNYNRRKNLFLYKICFHSFVSKLIAL